MVAGAAHGAAGRLPPPVLTVPGSHPSVAASGASAVLATVPSGGCMLRLLRLDRPSTPVRVKSAGRSARADGDEFIDDVWLGRASIAAETYDSPSPHGEAFSILPRPAAVRPVAPDSRNGPGRTVSRRTRFGCAQVVGRRRRA